MRAVAVLAVFADHLLSWPSGGFVGVDVFFVLSGFFITRLLIRERTRTGHLSFRNFYSRRVKRILPSALLVLTMTVVGAHLLLPATRAKQTLLDALYAAVFAANFHFEAVGADYFQQGRPPSPIQHYWSLSIEEQFYFVWPAVLVAIFAATRRRRRSRTWWMFGAMGLLVAASFAWAMHLSAADPNRAYFSTATRVWELGVGALVAIAGPWLIHIPSVVRPVLAYTGLAGVMASLFAINSTDRFPAPWAALPVLSTALVVAAFDGSTGVRGMVVLTNPAARWFGDISYTLYLWHWPVIQLLQAVMPKGPAFYVAATAIALSLTAITYRYYENPIRKSSWLTTTGGQSRTPSTVLWAVVGGVTAVAIVVAILGIQRADKARLEAEDYQPYNATDTAQPEKVDPCFGAPALVTPGCALHKPDVPLTPSVDAAADDTAGQSRCSRKEGGKDLLSCTYGDGGTIHIALVGDSHAAMILPALWSVLDANKWQLTTYIGTGCQWIKTQRQDCPIADIESRLVAGHYDLVLTAALRDWGGKPSDFEQMWGPVTATGARIAVVADGPSVSDDALACLDRDSNGDCGTPRDAGFARPDQMRVAAEGDPSIKVIDLDRFYCTKDRCPAVIGNVVVYRDTKGHITATFARTLAPALVDGIRQALAK